MSPFFLAKAFVLQAVSPTYVEKVTAFVTRPGESGVELLLIKHPTAGIQIPAGTVDEGETVENAVKREVKEETGLHGLQLAAKIGWRDELPPGRDRVIAERTRVYARPEPTSFDWAEFRRGIGVRFLRQTKGFAQVEYEECDQYPNPTYISYQITGWVPLSALAMANRRHFFHLFATGDMPDLWSQFADRHIFQLFWAPLDGLPEIINPQRVWLDFVQQNLGYRF